VPDADGQVPLDVPDGFADAVDAEVSDADAALPTDTDASAPPDVPDEIPCVPLCEGKQCGDDGCGSVCGMCTGPQDECAEGQCICQPVCAGVECGDDGCGGSCGGCDDGSLCTVGDQCVDGKCVNEAQICFDSNPCTDDECLPESGCYFPVNTMPCSDESVCTEGDICASGECTAGAAMSCDDANQCTSNACDPIGGCVFSDTDAPCSDGNDCTLGDACSGGKCVSGDWDKVECPDSDHDGVWDDNCPTTWNPDQNPDVCGALPASFALTRPIVLSQPESPTGASTWPRTNEPVEIPLSNGIIDQSVVGYWKLDGGLAKDFSSGKYDGELSGAPGAVLGAFDDEAGALAFDGSSKIDVPGTEQLLLGVDHLSGMAWVKPNGSNAGIILAKQIFAGAETRPAYYLQIASGKLVFSGCLDSFENQVSVWGIPVLPNEWLHVAFTYDGTIINLYQNGLLAASLKTGGSVYSGGTPLTFDIGYGAKPSSGDSGFFHGALDEVALFNRALTPEEVSAYYWSTAPYGTTFVPGAQADLDDIRVTETTSSDPEHVVPFEILGPRPHSDTLCPDAYTGLPFAEIPHIADREDLCGVVGYWKLDGNSVDSGPLVHGAAPSPDAEFAAGRFGGADGGMSLSAGFLENPHDAALSFTDFTIEAWALHTGPGDSVALASKGQSNEHNRNYHFFLADPNGSQDLACSFDEKETGALMSCTAALNGSIDRWRHYACVHTADAIELFADGLLIKRCDVSGVPYPNVYPTYLADHGTEPGWLVDEVIMHKIPKSREYMYRRANPGVPTVRFLASTEPSISGNGPYQWYDYALSWGDGAATQSGPIVSGLTPGQECYGLLSPCLGYAGWWRFNEGSGTVAVDSSTGKNNGAIEGASWGPGPELLALQVAGTGDHVAIPDSMSLRSPSHKLTLEAAASLAEDTDEQFLVSKGICEMNGSNNSYSLMVVPKVYPAQPQLQAAAYGSVALGVDPPKGAHSTQGYFPPDGVWRSLQLTYDDPTIKLFYGDSSSSAEGGGGINYSSTPVLIGKWVQSCSGKDFYTTTGLIDSVRLMNRALTLDEFLHNPMAGWDYGPGNWMLDCGGTICPDLAGYNMTCNAQDHCEYSNADQTGWKKWDKWIFVPPGSFLMGSPQSENGHQADESDVEGPAQMHPVSIATGFFIRKHEIVVEEYEACLADQGKCTPAESTQWPGDNGTNGSANGRLDHPQNSLKWQQAKEFCAWVAPDGGRLPTEAEWEYAAAGPVHRTYPWGDLPLPSCSNDTAVLNEAGGAAGFGCGGGGTLPAGLRQSGASWCGALDMAGNVWEWCEDTYHPSYQGAPGDGTAWVGADPKRIVRGGSFTYPPANLRTAERSTDAPEAVYAEHGARCVRPLE